MPTTISSTTARTGALLYDADGNGAGAAVQFATLGDRARPDRRRLHRLRAGQQRAGDHLGRRPRASPRTARPARSSTRPPPTDADGDRITYSLSGADAGLLTIDANGAVRLIAPGRFRDQGELYVQRRRQRFRQRRPRKAVTLTVTDVAEGAPTPIINETAGANDSTGHRPGRSTAARSSSPPIPICPTTILPSATIVGSISTQRRRGLLQHHPAGRRALILDVDAPPAALDSHPARLRRRTARRSATMTIRGSFDPGSTPHPTYGHNTDSLLQLPRADRRAPIISRSSSRIRAARSTGSYQIHVSIGPPATAAQIIEEDVDALISGAAVEPTPTSPIGFPTSASHYPDELRRSATTRTGELRSRSPATQQAATQLDAAASRQRLPASPSPQLIGRQSTAPADLRYAMSRRRPRSPMPIIRPMAARRARRHRLVQHDQLQQAGRRAIMPGWASCTKPATRSA